MIAWRRSSETGSEPSASNSSSYSFALHLAFARPRSSSTRLIGWHERIRACASRELSCLLLTGWHELRACAPLQLSWLSSSLLRFFVPCRYLEKHTACGHRITATGRHTASERDTNKQKRTHTKRSKQPFTWGAFPT